MRPRLKIAVPNLILALLFSGACSIATPPEPAPTVAPTATATPAPTPTPEPTPTPTPEPTPTATPVPPDPLFRYTYAVNLLRSAQYEEAIPPFGIVIRVLPDFAEAYHGRGLAHYHEEQEELALEDFNKAIELKPEYADAYRNRGVLHMNAGNLLRGTDDLQRALELYEAAGNTEGAEDARTFLRGR